MDKKISIRIAISLFGAYLLFMCWMVGVYSSSFRQQYPQLVSEFESRVGGVERFRPTYGLDIIPSPNVPSSYDDFVDVVKSNSDIPARALEV